MEEQSLCCVCFERERNVLLQPCAHLAICSVCAEQVGGCPICRQKITKRIKVKIHTPSTVRANPGPRGSKSTGA